MVTPEKHQQWKEWLAAIELDIRNLDRTHCLWSQLHVVFWQEEFPHWGHWAKYFLDTYTTYAVSAIRRQIRRNRQSISLDGLIEDLKASASQIDYAWWSTFARHGSEEVWLRRFGNAQGTLDIAKLDNACQQMHGFDNLLEIADRRLAHWDRRGVEADAGTEDITNALLALHGTLDHVHELVLGEFYTPNEQYAQMDLKQVFTVPWMRPTP